MDIISRKFFFWSLLGLKGLNLSQEHHHCFNTFSAVQSLVVVLRGTELQLNNTNNNDNDNNLLLLLCAFHKMIMCSLQYR